MKCLPSTQTYPSYSIISDYYYARNKGISAGFYVSRVIEFGQVWPLNVSKFVISHWFVHQFILNFHIELEKQ